MLNLVAVHPVQSDDRGYDSCDSEDIKRGLIRNRNHNLVTWLGLRKPWARWNFPA